MGYRSEVSLSLTLEALAKLPDLQEAVEAELEGKDIDTPMYNDLVFFADYGERSTSPEGVPFVNLGWSFIKWNNGYLLIASINNLINELRETSPESYHFIRIGEDFDDVVDDGILDDDLYISRVIKRGEV